MRQNNVKRERKHSQGFIAGQSGRIPWNAQSVARCLKHLQKEHALLVWEGRGREWDVLAEAFLFVQRNSSGIRRAAHTYRMAVVIFFLQKHKAYLRKLGLIRSHPNGLQEYDPALCEAFAKLPYKWPSGFSLDTVKKFVESAKGPN